MMKNHKQFLQAVLEMPINECIDNYHQIDQWYRQEVEDGDDIKLLDFAEHRELWNKIKQRIFANPDAYNKRIAYYYQSFTDALM